MSDTVSVRPAAWALILPVAIGGAFYLAGKNMELRAPREQPMTISVSADAKVSAPPDIGVLSFGIQTGRQPTAKRAMDLLRQRMTAIVDATKTAGVAEKDIATEQFWLNPAYDYQDGRQVPQGFEASQSLTVKVRDLDKVGDVLSAVTAAGANQVGGVTFSIDEPDSLRAQARERAIEKAKAKAAVLAKGLGMTLDRMTGFSEGGSVPPRPLMMEKANFAVGMSADAGTPIPAGEQEITSEVTLTYELR